MKWLDMYSDYLDKIELHMNHAKGLKKLKLAFFVMILAGFPDVWLI